MSAGKFMTAFALAVAFGMTIGVLDILNASAAAEGGILVVPRWLVWGGSVLFLFAMATLIPALRCVRESDENI